MKEMGVSGKLEHVGVSNGWLRARTEPNKNRSSACLQSELIGFDTLGRQHDLSDGQIHASVCPQACRGGCWRLRPLCDDLFSSWLCTCEGSTDRHRQQSDGVEFWPLSSECGTGDATALPGPQTLPAHLFTPSLSWPSARWASDPHGVCWHPLRTLSDAYWVLCAISRLYSQPTLSLEDISENE